MIILQLHASIYRFTLIKVLLYDKKGDRRFVVMKDQEIIRPIYQQIAIDLANRIAHGEFPVDTKLYGRSTLSGQYNVSPETIRRAVTLLEDMDIVKVNQGSGIIVKSIDKTYEFIDKFKTIETMESLKKDITNAMEEKTILDKKLQNIIDKMIDIAERFKNSNPFAPMELEIPANSKVIGKTIAEVKFWQNTGATIIGIRRKNTLVLSPGPYAVFNKGDVFIMIGDENSYERVKKYLNEKG